MLIRRMQFAGLLVAVGVSLGVAASDADKPLVFEAGERRDPFAFSARLNLATIAPPPPVIPAIPSFDIAGTRVKLAELYDQAESHFLDAQSSEAIQMCDSGLALIQGIPVESRHAIGSEQERILRLRTAATRALSREEAEKQFKALNLSLTGVVVHDGQSQAIVNSKVVTRGQVIALPESTQDAVVLEIRDGAVVFLYRGYRILREIKADSVR